MKRCSWRGLAVYALGIETAGDYSATGR